LWRAAGLSICWGGVRRAGGLAGGVTGLGMGLNSGLWLAGLGIRRSGVRLRVMVLTRLGVGSLGGRAVGRLAGLGVRGGEVWEGLLGRPGAVWGVLALCLLTAVGTCQSIMLQDMQLVTFPAMQENIESFTGDKQQSTP